MDISLFSPLPTILTKKALLLIDFQNDFVRSQGALYVPNTADFLDTLPSLAQAFRHIGDVFWIRSLYESRRSPFNSGTGAQLILNRREDEERKTRLSQGESLKSDEHLIDDEAFLSTDFPKCCAPDSHGAKFPAPLIAAINRSSDTLWDKHDYSALQDDDLLLTFRTRLITEIYICGSLSNVSVYATALDAARHGFSVTLVEDCLGFRSFARHEEAMRQMADVLGASGITSEELHQEIDWEETHNATLKSNLRHIRPTAPVGIEGDLNDLEVRTGGESGDKRDYSKYSPERQHRRTDAILADLVDNETEEPSNSTGAHYAHHPLPEIDTDTPHVKISAKQIQAREPRMKRTGRKAESVVRNQRGRPRLSKVLRPGDHIGEGDSRIIYDLDLPEDAFEKIYGEVNWQKMYHMKGQVPRLVAVQGKILPDGSAPIYRHPADESPPLRPFTTTVDQVCTIVERIIGHPLNHALIQLYRDGQDSISEHADKSLDIARGSFICNLSLGAQRVMVLRTKSQKSGEGDSVRQTQHIPLPHESLFVLGEKTNMRWLHGIRCDKRPVSEKSMEDLAYGGQRISLTFRNIGTFLTPAGDAIWGQGAVSKSQDHPRRVVDGDRAEIERLIHAFGRENHEAEFQWDMVYGSGFDVVNFADAETAQLMLSGDIVSDLRVRLALAESGYRYRAGDAPACSKRETVPLFIKSDGTELAGDVKILAYLAKQPVQARGLAADMLEEDAMLQQVEKLLKDWRQFLKQGDDGFELLGVWDTLLNSKQYLGGTSFSMSDCSFWPVLWNIVQEKGQIPRRLPNLRNYFQRAESRGTVRAVLGEMDSILL